MKVAEYDQSQITVDESNKSAVIVSVDSEQHSLISSFFDLRLPKTTCNSMSNDKFVAFS